MFIFRSTNINGLLFLLLLLLLNISTKTFFAFSLMRGLLYKRKLNTGYSFPRFYRESFYLKFDYFFATLKALFLILTGYEVVKGGIF